MIKAIRILLVEDNEGDIILTREALKEGRIANEITVARDGIEALEALKKEENRPDLILLDINLPRMDGKEVLGVIKNSPELKSIPVVMLTTSSSEKDIVESYSRAANCYITKPVDLDKFMTVVRVVENFWVHIVSLPKH